jgi:hypothetical protein
MRLTTIALASVFTLGSTFALAQAGSSGAGPEAAGKSGAVVRDGSGANSAQTTGNDRRLLRFREAFFTHLLSSVWKSNDEKSPANAGLLLSFPFPNQIRSALKSTRSANLRDYGHWAPLLIQAWTNAPADS